MNKEPRQIFYLKRYAEARDELVAQLETILQNVSVASGYPVEEIKGKSKKGGVIFPRFSFSSLCREICDAPFEVIGQVINRKHCTVMYECKAVDEVLEFQKYHCDLILKISKL